MRTCKMHMQDARALRMHMHMHMHMHMLGAHAHIMRMCMPYARTLQQSPTCRAHATQLLVVLLRDLDLLGGDDLLGVATVPLLRLRGLDAPMRFRVPLLHATRLCGELEGSLVLSHAE